ncbi:hypothetical protein C8R44DRAFT_864805 [Mycena epipterygia]|nr:hypothetical protein C8R44DRAFT_864805 [Mycena epipterygia]
MHEPPPLFAVVIRLKPVKMNMDTEMNICDLRMQFATGTFQLSARLATRQPLPARPFLRVSHSPRIPRAFLYYLHLLPHVFLRVSHSPPPFKLDVSHISLPRMPLRQPPAALSDISLVSLVFRFWASASSRLTARLGAKPRRSRSLSMGIDTARKPLDTEELEAEDRAMEYQLPASSPPCVSSTIVLVGDAYSTYAAAGIPDFSGTTPGDSKGGKAWSAETVHGVTVAHLNGDFGGSSENR